MEREGRKDESHEEAAHEKRNWVRLSYDCNNHCTFCLDSDAHNGTMRSTLDIKVQIIEGRKRGAERLILSGGEPTMHPNFLDFVKLGNRAGYRKVQTVTNGRMFKYPEFLNRAADNGLNEITFSLHGHTAKLHDALVGTPGAFVEETAGLKAALASGRFIVNVDIVINKQNVKHLPEMLETFIGWGVKEFDLLHVIPFGNAWTQARDHLFYDLDGNLEYLQKAFSYARRPDIHIWLNRFPPAYAEGFEDLIQDPYKLNDEVRGRREEFDRYLAFGQKLQCREPDRCKRCYLQPLCDGLDVALEARRASSVDALRVTQVLPAAVTLPAAPVAELIAEHLSGAEELAKYITTPALALELRSYKGLSEALGPSTNLFGKPLSYCIAQDLNAARALLAVNGTFDIHLMLTKETAPFIEAHPELSNRVVLVQPNYDRVTDALANDVDLPTFLAQLSTSFRLQNVPACLAKHHTALPDLRVLDVAMLGPDGRVDMKGYTRRFVEDGFYSKALRCGGCSQNASCRGVHVNWVRAHSFAPLVPRFNQPDGLIAAASQRLKSRY
ncbi:MAG: radical SAM protein [Polyangiaceae bacterium]|nr:radical SAM protein [Polyangiaceae bacterium]